MEDRFILSQEAIQEKVKEIARQIERDYEGKEVVFVGVLKGAFIFLADLVRNIEKVDVLIDFIKVSSYGASTETSGVVRLDFDTTMNLEGRHVILVEDILDTGLTLRYLKELLEKKNPLSLRIAVLLDKFERRKVQIEAEYVGFRVPDKFLVGYGLDYAERYRNIPYVMELKE